MPDNRQVQKNAVPNQSAGNVEETFWRLKINDNNEGGDAFQPGPYPDRPGEPDCLHYMRTGLCGYGNNCRFNHPPYVLPGGQYNGELPERVGQPDCEYFLKTGTCKYGSSCKYHHPRDRRGAGPVTFNILGLPMRQEEKSCPYYMQTGSCKFGVACKFHHPQPASLGNILPLAGPAVFGSSGSITSSGVPYLGGYSGWSLPRVPYTHGPRVQGQQSYMPVLLSPSQGWNTHMGNMNTVPAPTLIEANLAYNSKNSGESGSSSQILPERPDQPECRFFMNTGTCKYGSDCKFHHPKERLAISATNALGLPSRPGQPICSYYSNYGLCKFGPTCKFDHPFSTHPYNYGYGLPTLSMLDSTILNYPRNILTVPLSETSLGTLSKSPEWIPKPDVASEKNQNSEKNVPEDPPEGPESSLPAASEPLDDQSG